MRFRFWVESALSIAASVLLILTLVSREWIEALFGVDPDGGDGSLEWLVVVAVAAAALVLAILARREWRWSIATKAEIDIERPREL